MLCQQVPQCEETWQVYTGRFTAGEGGAWVSNSQRERALEYLLGELPESEAAEFEEQCFIDDELFEETSALENDLIDSFVRGELSEAERQQFEKGYLVSPARRANVEFSRALAEHLSTLEPEKITSERESVPGILSFQSWLGPRRRRSRLVWAAAALIAITTLSWTIVVNRRLNHEIDSMRAQQTEFQNRVQDLRQQIASLDSRLHEIGSGEVQQEIPGTTILSLALVPGINRSPTDASKLVIAPVAPLVQLKLYMEHDDYPSYRVSIETADGRQIWQKNGLKSQTGQHGANGTKAVTVKMPSSILKSSDYLVKLDGLAANGKFEETEDYRFQVVRR